MTTGAETENQNSIITNGTTSDAPADPTSTSTDLSTQSNPVNKSKCINSRKLWSFEEDQKLLGSLATTKDYSYISREVFKNSRSVHSVRHRAIALMNQTQSVDFNEYLTVPLINDHLMTSDIVQFQQIVQPPLEPPVSFRWTPSEDQMLLAFIAMHGKKYTWASRCLFNGKRSPDACRFRFRTILNSYNDKIQNQ
jgi:hypothetical protein